MAEAAGESVADREASRAGVPDDRQPGSVIENELANTVAGLLWRRRRIAAYEAAALTAGIGELPPDPDAVEPEPTWTGIDPPAAAPAATRPAHLRAVLRGSRGRLPELRAAAALAAGLADAAEGDEVGPDVGLAVVHAAATALGWAWQPDPWEPVLAACDLAPTSVWGRAWTAGELRAVLEKAAVMVGREPAGVLAATTAQLAAEVANTEEAIVAREEAEQALVGEMRAARDRVCGRAGHWR